MARTARKQDKSSAKTTIIACTSDQHCGGTTALCPPQVSLDDGGHYTASKAQRWLWQNWGLYWDRVEQLRDQHQAQLIEVFNGDMTDGDHHGTTQILSGNPTAQASVVNAAMELPLALSPDHLLFIRGTEAHVGKSAAFEERIATGCKKDGRAVIMNDEAGTASHWHKALDIDGVVMDFTHHGRMGQRSWTKGNTVNLTAFQIWAEHNLAGRTAPDIAVRSHMHQYWDTYNAYPTRVIQTASWQLATAFVHKVVAESSLADVGGLILMVRDGELTVEPMLFTPDAPPVWRAK